MQSGYERVAHSSLFYGEMRLGYRIGI